MKIYFTVTDTDETKALAALDTIELYLEKTWYRIESILPLFRKVLMARTSANVYGVWLNLEMEIQGVRYTNALSVVTTVVPDIISQNDKTSFKNLNAVTVNEFMVGKLYLIPYTAGAVTDMMPDATQFPIENLADGVYVGTHYMYQATDKVQVRNGNSFQAYILDLDIIGVAQSESRIAQKEKDRSARFINQVANSTNR